MDRLRMMWLSYQCVANAAMVLRDPTEQKLMWQRANRRLDTYFAELEREARDYDPVLLRELRQRRQRR